RNVNARRHTPARVLTLRGICRTLSAPQLSFLPKAHNEKNPSDPSRPAPSGCPCATATGRSLHYQGKHAGNECLCEGGIRKGGCQTSTGLQGVAEADSATG